MLIAGEDVSHILLVGMKNGTATLDKTDSFFTNRIYINIYVNPCNHTPEHLSQRSKNLCSHKNLYTNVYSRFICKSPKWNQNVLQKVNG